MSIAERAIQPLRAGQRLTVQEVLRRWDAMPEVNFASRNDFASGQQIPVVIDGRQGGQIAVDDILP